MKEPEIAANSARNTIDKIRAKQNEANHVRRDAGQMLAQEETSSTGKKQAQRRVSNLTKPVSTNDRNQARLDIMRALLLGEITQGQALKALRITVLGLKQDAFGKLVTVSRKTLSEVENDKGNYTPDIINKLFRPFGLKVGLVPVSQQIFRTLFERSE
ncbi:MULTISPECIES: helix-turn-helix transcriptional regulator [Rahnella]|jgi:DNA-binding XRE family transcriptional regulator|uniref:Helix-turn-helix domain protein n=1 Tax=Rahnella sp. (strain Y9602) TaxID=2703885 RepID=A0A0H3FI22_RAHSY|nr:MULTISPECIES: helix-turn-helix transcriptional regulator [Rahnella]AFE61102.1 helix-turn-helix domain protein [Rahnella aquatilis HX2]AYA09669.1 XRE family transcriptional regulator [Rahnella aquatilis]ADW76425.1 helix-turn-helix domain protein [Rahnella aceris]MBU9842866.1 helix-turn-helix transcriptional regulator [Rahnella aceris]MBU9863423.1 helix-turn-helix transcriptional regulator [Rahnella aceris]